MICSSTNAFVCCLRSFFNPMQVCHVSDLPEGSGTPAVIAAAIEEEIHKEFKNTDSKYKNKIRSRVANLRDKKNPALRENVLVGSISAERLCKMTPEVRYSLLWESHLLNLENAVRGLYLFSNAIDI